MEIRTLGIDLGKLSLHAVGFDAHGAIVLRRRFSRTQLIRFVATMPSWSSAWRPAVAHTTLAGGSWRADTPCG